MEQEPKFVNIAEITPGENGQIVKCPYCASDTGIKYSVQQLNEVVAKELLVTDRCAECNQLFIIKV